MRIKELRKEKNQTQNEVAAILGISRQVFANYEKEINYPDPKMLIKLSDYFEVSIDYLVGRTDELGVIHKENAQQNLEAELLFCFRRLDSDKQNRLIGYAYALTKQEPKI